MPLPNTTAKKIITYADDTNFLLQTEKEIKTIIETFTEFGRGSGEKINADKSKILGLGRWTGKTKLLHPYYSDRPTQIVRHYVNRQPDKRRQRHMDETD